MKFFRNKLAVTILVLSVTFLILISFGVKGSRIFFIRNSAGAIFNPVQGGVYKVNNSIKQFLSFIINFSDVKNENNELTKKNSELENKLVEYNSLKNENIALRKELKFKKEKSEYSYIGCDIIGKTGDGILDQFVINKGSNDGIKKRMVALTADGLVGQVSYVQKDWSIVQSLADENISVGAEPQEVKQKDDVSSQGIVKGYRDKSNSLLAKIYYLPVDSKIKKGDVILTSGIDNSYPRGIRIGSVTKVELDKGKVMKNAIIKPYVNFDKIQELLIAVPKNPVNIKY